MNLNQLLPNRTIKPRSNGLTMVIDGGISLSDIDNIMEVSKDYIDYVKLGWGTSLVINNLSAKIKKYKSHDIPICFGGTLFEFFFIHNKLDFFDHMIAEYDLNLIEISDGTVDIGRSKKLELIEQYSKKYKVLSEFGSKDTEAIYAPSFWVSSMQEELSAGAWKVIAEGRESGQAGVFRKSSEVRTGLVDDVVNAIQNENIIWEAPQKSQQVWFIKKFGPNVNLGNISTNGIIGLETLRLGLRGDTLLHFHEND